MAHGQIDPARLEGDALKRWYRRSPAEIEAERSRTADRAYRDFFAPSDQGDLDAKQQGERYELAADASRPFWDYWGIRGCQNCHGYTPETLPPYGGHLPFPPSHTPRVGGSSGGGDGGAKRRDEWSDQKQCTLQFEADRQICQKARSPKCWKNQNKRLGHCNSTGEVGTPALGFGPPGR
jgi:hypothetical protein